MVGRCHNEQWYQLRAGTVYSSPSTLRSLPLPAFPVFWLIYKPQPLHQTLTDRLTVGSRKRSVVPLRADLIGWLHFLPEQLDQKITILFKKFGQILTQVLPRQLRIGVNVPCDPRLGRLVEASDGHICEPILLGAQRLPDNP